MYGFVARATHSPPAVSHKCRKSEQGSSRTRKPVINAPITVPCEIHQAPPGKYLGCDWTLNTPERLGENATGMNKGVVLVTPTLTNETGTIVINVAPTV